VKPSFGNLTRDQLPVFLRDESIARSVDDQSGGLDRAEAAVGVVHHGCGDVSTIGPGIEPSALSLLQVGVDAFRGLAATALPVDVGDRGLGGSRSGEESPSPEICKRCRT
jgi:hypothetical protein